MTTTIRRRKVVQTAYFDRRPRPLSGNAYLALMRMLGHNHQSMAEALGVTKWTSVAWRTGRRNITPLAEMAIRGLLLQHYGGSLLVTEVDRIIESAKR